MSRLTLGLLLCCLLGPLQAEEQQAAQARSEAELSGLIIDNTISRFGHDFHRYLSFQLQDAEELENDLVVRERPSARWGSLVWVEYGPRTVYRRFLQPNMTEIEAIAEDAARVILEDISRSKLQNLLQDTFDMDRDEL
ncbi:curli production assembly protein CsgE [Pseudomonas sp. MTM4]|uniref:CsgE family curli-type amyloid fiber assembly protein n=1 Tax=unclassified Pseudomonas TaxID=196821 RepID=UPI00103FBB41|nr:MULTISPECIES: CsgE family curli-type amyloid fiber assembly protein [unclassified Pseudomonas]MBC8649920.1 curli production assembly protein CsgE [Pseudomonas sp. MT4]QXY92258.1 curli production assembly protein CsgE [Pseudomonas sp. MTM4]TCD19496.1 curli production assembly protein CsgE [Pseudomonas sp. IC_126]